MISGGVTGTPRRPAAKWWSLTTVTLAVSVEICCAAVIWLAASDGDAGYLLLLTGALLGLAVLWAICAVFGLIKYRAWLLSAVVPVVVLVAIAVVYSGAAEQVGWRVSKAALEEAAAQCIPLSEPSRIGVYTIEWVDRTDTGCHFYTRGGFLDPVGFAYLPDGAPPERRSSETTYRQYDGSWYRFVVSW
ncbi:hypothetical protein [Nocardia testacea]|uniref:hypothetical protein n=1 Tax=Nocardia testacea TaxID=248551 RepID=UPI000303100D|nr:hypothetical protein [Nocardia testacea]